MLTLIEIIDQIKRWGVHDIRRILHHESWTGRKERPPFYTGRPGPARFEDTKSEDLVSFKELRRRFQELVNDKGNKFDTTIDRTHLRIARAFLLIDDNDRLNQLLAEDDEIEESILNSNTFDEYPEEMRRQLDELDANRADRSGDISKTQLCYALECLLFNEKASIQKITWEGVKSKWGPKIVLYDGGKKYLYIYNSQSEEADRLELRSTMWLQN